MAKKTKNRINSFVRYIYGPIGARKMAVQFKDPDGVFKIEGPFFVFSNHTGHWDPFLTSHKFKTVLHWVVSDAASRTWFNRWFLRLTGCIPKTKGRSDSKSIRSIIQVIKQKEGIGIYPEGTITWDGHLQPLIYSTAKMVKSFKIPVVAVTLSGNFLNYTRWSVEVNQGKTVFEPKVCLTVEQIEELSVDEIYNHLQEALAHDEIAWQKKNKVEFKGKRKAEHIEYALFKCSACGVIDSLKSEGNNFSCQFCGNSIHYNKHCLFQPVDPKKDKVKFDNIRDWNLWQLDELKKTIFELATPETTILSEKECTMQKGDGQRVLTPFFNGLPQLSKDGLIVTSVEGEKLHFEIEKMKGVNVQVGEKLEFFYEDLIYRMDFPGIVSSYKWYMAIIYLREFLKK